MGLKKDLKGLDEIEIKKFFKLAIVEHIYYGEDRLYLLDKKLIRKSKYLKALLKEATIEVHDVKSMLDKNIGDQDEVEKYLKNSIK